ncbi:hypothetical protein, partial [Ruegeria sp. Ofav3-42]|uniref:hypothetical protein n=1 Tax=Ruegeria sp. Ofav3-42 TaxID=2917759 RepID=UPI001EF54C85
ILGQIQACGLYCHWVAPFLAVDDNCTLAHLMPVEQEPPTSSGLEGYAAAIIEWLNGSSGPNPIGEAGRTAL